ncbi:MAG: 50S ribosomal protein L1, partial [Proteobacteria bacterium]|nr:50S ribosomal protein L1 [Pseudomonadota bacterium]
KLAENIVAFVDRLVQLKPSTSKGIYLRAISVSSTMGPGFKVDPLQVRSLLK